MTTLAEVKVVTADECGCEFTENPALHDHLLSIETMTAPHAGVVVAQMISDEDHGCGGTGKEFDYPGDFKRFINQHNWRDPVGMQMLADAVWYASEQTYKG